LDKFPEVHEGVIIPGDMKYGDGSIIINHGRKAVVLKVVNTGDRPVQVC
jgi:urease